MPKPKPKPAPKPKGKCSGEDTIARPVGSGPVRLLLLVAPASDFVACIARANVVQERTARSGP